MAANQTPQDKEAEFFALQTTGRKGLEEAVDKMTPEIMAVAAPDVVKAGSVWLQRAVVSVANNDKLVDVIKTRTGLFSIIKCFEKAATMGLQLGGQFPQAHLVPFAGQASLIIDQRGYKHAACYGPGAVLDDIAIRRVYEGEDFAIDFAANTVRHTYDGKKARGKLVGVYGIITKRGGEQSIDYMTVDEARQVRNAHSIAWKKDGDTPWKTDEDMMVEKTAAKRFLKPYAASSEGLSMLLSSDDEPYTPPDPTPRNNGDRMAEHLDRKAARAVAREAAVDAEAEVVDEQPSEAAPQQADAKQSGSGEPVELF